MFKVIKEDKSLNSKLFKNITELSSKYTNGENSPKLISELISSMEEGIKELKNSTTISDMVLDSLSGTKFRKFEKEDYYGYDPEKFSDGSEPLIATLDNADILVSDDSISVDFVDDNDEDREFIIESGSVKKTVENAKLALSICEGYEDEGYEELVRALKNNGFKSLL